MVKFAAAFKVILLEQSVGTPSIFFSPAYVVGMSDQELEQLAQMMIFEFSQQAVARGDRLFSRTLISIGRSPTL